MPSVQSVQKIVQFRALQDLQSCSGFSCFQENSHLQTKLNEAETNIAVLRSEITALNIELHEKTFEHER